MTEPVAGKSPEEIQAAVNERLATCDPVKIGEEEFDIKVSLEKKEKAAATEEKPAEGTKGTKGGKRNKRKTLSKRSARKSHKSRRVFGGKRK